jgi:hypothetical protein
MKIKESKNLKYDKLPWLGLDEGYDRLEPDICYLESFNRLNDIINLYFRNGSQAAIKARNVEGGKEMDLIKNKLNEFLGKPYQEILNADF